jgi:hypothetical protein
MVTERDGNNQFLEYCFEEDDLEAAGKQMALEESIMTVREEGFSDENERDRVDNGVFFEIPRSGIQWCCEEFEQKAGRNTFVTASSHERIHGITRWHIKCPYCEMALIASKYSMKPEK